MTKKRRELQIFESKSVLEFHCSACSWTRDIIIGRPGEMSEDAAKKQFEQHVCADDSSQAGARIVREATEKV